MKYRCSTCLRMFEAGDDFSAADMRCPGCRERGAADEQERQAAGAEARLKCSTCFRAFDAEGELPPGDVRCPACTARAAADEQEQAKARSWIASLDPAERAARLMSSGGTKFRAKKQLMADGLSEEEASLAAEDGWRRHQNSRRAKLLLFRLAGFGIMLLGLAISAALWFAIEGVIIVVFPAVTLSLAGLVAVIAPDTLETFGDWFR